MATKVRMLTDISGWWFDSETNETHPYAPHDSEVELPDEVAAELIARDQAVAIQE